MNYQAVARDSAGSILQYHTIGLLLDVTWGIGETAYQEAQTVVTNEHGLFTIRIGEGTPTGAGEFPNYTDINWYEATQWGLRIFADFEGGTAYNYFGGAFIKAVPFANTANEANVLLDSAIVANPFNPLDKKVYTDNGYKLGVGTTAPDTTLHVLGKLKYQDGSEGAGKLLMSDQDGNAGWSGATGWQNITLLNGWDEFGGVTPTYNRMPDGTVRLRGRITDHSTDIIFVLPAGSRPAQNLFIPVYNDDLNGNSFMIVNVNGEVTMYASGSFDSSTAFFLDGIDFLAEQ